MRVSGLLLFLVIMVLSARPVLLLSHSEERTVADCCQNVMEEPGHCDEKKPEPVSDDCCGDTCNPFLSCCTQLDLRYAATLIQNPGHPSPADHPFTFYSASLQMQDPSDFWQPPRFSVE